MHSAGIYLVTYGQSVKREQLICLKSQVVYGRILFGKERMFALFVWGSFPIAISSWRTVDLSLFHRQDDAILQSLALQPNSFLYFHFVSLELIFKVILHVTATGSIGR